MSRNLSAVVILPGMAALAAVYLACEDVEPETVPVAIPLPEFAAGPAQIEVEVEEPIEMEVERLIRERAVSIPEHEDVIKELTRIEELPRKQEQHDELMEQIQTVQSDYPDIAALLQRISEDEKKHCDEIREMLMRSDAFAGSLA